jgi:hypothetical protein
VCFEDNLLASMLEKHKRQYGVDLEFCGKVRARRANDTGVGYVGLLGGFGPYMSYRLGLG